MQEQVFQARLGDMRVSYCHVVLGGDAHGAGEQAFGMIGIDPDAAVIRLYFDDAGNRLQGTGKQCRHLPAKL